MEAVSTAFLVRVQQFNSSTFGDVGEENGLGEHEKPKRQGETA